MPVRTLSLTDFRSYRRLDIELAGGPHVVVGRNAAGKTNLVESLVLLSSGRSHRGGADTEMVRWGGDFARVGAGVEAHGRTEELEVVIFAVAARTAGPASASASTASTAAPRPWPPSCARSSSRPRTCCSSSARPRCAGTSSTTSWPSAR